ncbi:MAG: Bromodomain-containing protein [Olpidium bornovanus]|uniref:Bromodomain-containing protein n=1 Tax=Olpidium bornovanus TaxID=278681 RepID=A0A8H7ZT32_9FUNG|nr:MAG: Bromodomain-containing protein [Olpidium bornovanus]
MTKEQFRYCISVIKSLKRHPSAQEFLKPVDPIAWNIPDYTTIIKRPMDLGTVDDKLAAGHYADPDAFAKDVRLVFQNCYLYNGRQSAFSQMAMQVELIFESQMKKVPAASPSVRSAASPSIRSAAPPQTIRRAKATRVSAAAPPQAAVTPQATPAKPAAAPRPRPSSSRKSVPAARKSSSGRNSPGPGLNRQMRFCSATLNELCKKQYAEINWDFLRPVDPVALNIPEYPSIIKQPMDLSTIRLKLNAGEYSSPHEFENDVNLMFDNCFTFNRAGDPVYVNGERLREVFLCKWKDLPLTPAPKKAAAKPSAKSANKGGGSRRKSASVPARKAKGSDVEEESEESKSEAEGNGKIFLYVSQMNLVSEHPICTERDALLLGRLMWFWDGKNEIFLQRLQPSETSSNSL